MKKAPWWLCCGWWSPWCVLDTLAHRLHIKVQWICDRHDANILGETLTKMRANDEQAMCR